MVDGLMAIQERELKENSALNTLLKEKRKAENTIENIMSAIEQGVITKTTTKRLKELETLVEDLDKQILIERGKINVKLTEKEMREFYTQALTLEPQMLINYLVKEIVLFDDKIEIYFNSPLRESPDNDSQGFSFYRKVVDFPIFVQERSCIVMIKMVVDLRI